ncbi:DUF262 domain-containing protein [Geofilum rubicundum]|uniref:Uncharacterized protein n=1 Tax=Geofilum rubicundum JCM 15548 TaxID=1236989 RepID=A0A0E9M0U7_9BACT|nr:DUF262 domain-containing protein [Geofilum rubicundum]GAO31178.1 hypothetical protein JCM15548_13519 [Geofilum rubicundum JCM 15548]
MSTHQLHPQIIKTQDLFAKANLTIPDYQRPYKWTSKNVNQLIDDIVHHQTKSAYRLGTIVFYKDKKQRLNVVDGQQRTVTLLLIALAIHSNEGRLKEAMTKAKVRAVESQWFNHLAFKNLITLNNIRDNYREIARRVADFDVATVLFFFEKCELVEVVLQDVSEAFQFFDSQNARGKDLEPHDLLKAFHLREMAEVSTEHERMQSVAIWENQNMNQLKIVFANFLYRIRNWSKGQSARHFTKNEADLFKGISPSIKEPFPFADLYRIGHFYVDGYNRDFNRNIDRNKLNYPFQINQVIINGKRFFEMIDHYMEVLNDIKSIENQSNEAKRIYKTLESYDGRNRTGDKYVRNLFDCCLIYYWDKFGAVEMDRAVEKFFIWAYSLRLNMKNVQLASIDNYALEGPYVFKTIKEALHPSEVLNIKLPSLTNVSSTKTKDLEQIFKELKYLND